MGEGDPSLNAPPFAPAPLEFEEDDAAPPFDAQVVGAVSGLMAYPLWYPVNPTILTWQRNNLRHFKPGVGDIVELLIIPTNHWISFVRFDVTKADSRLAVMTSSITGMRYRVDNSAGKDPYKDFVAAEETEFATAAAAQGLSPIPLDAPGSQFLSLLKAGNVDITADTPVGGGPISVTSASGYVTPYYVEPEFVVPNGKPDLMRF
jgi:hypothetical protein